MTSTQKKNFEQYVKKLIEKFTPILFLDRYNITVKHGVVKESSMMECEVQYPYLEATILYSDEAYKEWKEGNDLNQYIIHELLHITVSPMRFVARERFSSEKELEDRHEELVETITNILMKMLTL